MASARPGWSCWRADHASIAATASPGHLVPICRPCPVAGRPRVFFGTIFLVEAIIYMVPNKQAEGKRQLPPQP